MAVVCGSCGAESPAGFRFCGSCGAPLAAEGAARELRKTVTLLFCDLTGSTALGERLDPEALRHVLARYFDAIRGVIERHGGTVEKFAGDAVMAVFGIPQLREDDALRAVRAAAEIRALLPLLAEELGIALELRTGVNTGRVVTGRGETLATGDAVNVAARLEQAASPGEILIGPETRRLVRDAVEVEPAGPFALKGKAEPVEAFRLLRVDPAAPAVARRLDAPFVGRVRELRMLEDAFALVVDDASCHVVTLLGPAGVGKTRLADEFLVGAPDAFVLRGHCPHYGDGITFYPLVEALAPLHGRAQATLELVGRGGVSVPQELFLAVRRLLEELAAERPVVLVLDDLQWGQPMLLDLLDSIADLSRGAPLMLLCVARSELLEQRPGWGGGRHNATSLLLEPLDAAEASLLLDGLECDLPASARAEVVAASDGNPLFLEEMVALVRETGELRVPPTIEALIAARLELLAGDERAVIERAAVEGNVFHSGAVGALSPESIRASLQTHLGALVRKELIRPEPKVPPPRDQSYRFRHLLIRDAAYEELPKELRADLHERFAAWLDAEGADLVELDEIVGWHLEQAVRYRRELGLPVPEALTAGAHERLASAGRRAGARVDARAAIALLGRALALLPEGDPRRAGVQVPLAEASTAAAQYERARALLDEVEAAVPGDPRAAVARFFLLLQTRPDEAHRYAESALPAAEERLRASGDDCGLAKVLQARSMVQWHASRIGAAAELLKDALAHARRVDARDLIFNIDSMLLAGLIWGPAPAEELRAALDERDAPDLPPYREQQLLPGRAVLARMEGRFDDARALQRRLREELLPQHGQEVLRWGLGQMAGQTELAAGDVDAAIAILRRSYDELGRLGEHAYRSTTGAMLATALAAAARYDEALSVVRNVEAESIAVDRINFAVCRAVEAKERAARGRLDEAERLAREGLAWADETDFVGIRGYVREVLAEVLAARGSAGADEVLAEAVAIYEAKGDRVFAEAARRRALQSV